MKVADFLRCLPMPPGLKLFVRAHVDCKDKGREGCEVLETKCDLLSKGLDQQIHDSITEMLPHPSASSDRRKMKHRPMHS